MQQHEGRGDDMHSRHADGQARDVPAVADLPYLDRHDIAIPVPRAQAWQALRSYATDGLGVADTNPLAVLLGTQPRSGFEITTEEPPRRLVARGRHRFAEYAIVFELRMSRSSITRLEAHSYARFIGVRGAVYRGLVIGTRFHVLATQQVLLRAIRRRALRLRPHTCPEPGGTSCHNDEASGVSEV